MTRSEAVVKLLDSGSVTWEQTRAEKKAQIAENTRLHFEREAMEAAKNESPEKWWADSAKSLHRDWFGTWPTTAEKPPVGIESIEAQFLREMTAIDKRRESRARVVPQPKCIGGLKEHGPLVERWLGSLLGGSSKVLMCDGCYVHAEQLMAKDAAADDKERSAAKSTMDAAVSDWWRGKNRTGLVPQSFGDERVGGIWASRGMR